MFPITRTLAFILLTDLILLKILTIKYIILERHKDSEPHWIPLFITSPIYSLFKTFYFSNINIQVHTVV
jgi:hypothetical protein